MGAIELVFEQRNWAGGTESKLTMLVLDVIITFIGRLAHIIRKSEEVLTILQKHAKNYGENKTSKEIWLCNKEIIRADYSKKTENGLT